MAPQVRFTTAPVIAPAPSEAGNAAVSATSLSRGRGGGQEVRARGLDDRAREVVHGQVDERDTLHGGRLMAFSETSMRPARLATSVA